MAPQFLNRRMLVIASLCCIAAAAPATAQQWPDKPIRLVVPAPAGGVTDVVARLLADQLRVNLGQTVLVDNKPGGSAVVAERAVMAAPDDGTTWMVAPSSVMSDIPLTVKTPFDVLKTFTYVAEASSMVHVLVANDKFPPDKVNAILDYVKRNPRSVSVANHSLGTRSNLLGEMLKSKSGNDMLVVPYKGSAPMLVDLMGNEVQLTFEVVSNVLPHIKSGKLKAYAVVSSTRSRQLPDVPSFGELGLPEFVLPHASIGVFVLSSTPRPVVDRIHREIAKAVAAPRFRDALAAQGVDFPQDASLDQLRKTLAATTEHNKAMMGKLQLRIGPE